MARDLLQEAGLSPTGPVGRDLFEEAGISDKPASRSIVDIVSGGIGAIADDISNGRAALRKRERDEAMARGNEASTAMIEDQQASGTYDQLQERASQISASKAAQGGALNTGIDLARDTGVNLVRGVGAIGSAATGVTGFVADAAGTALGVNDPLGSLAKVGVDFRTAGKGFDEFDKWAAGYLSDTGKSKEAKLEATKGFTDTLLTLGGDPRLMFQEITKSLPGTLMAGKVGEAAVGVYGARFASEAKAAGLTGEAAQAFIANAFKTNADKITRAAMIGSAAGEGLQQAGGLSGKAQAEGVPFKDYAAPALVSGALDAAISLGSTKLANKIGIGDIESDVALSKANKSLRAAGQAEIGSGKTAPAFWLNRGVIEGAKEGLFEEMPQSVQEAIAENLAFGRPWDQGIGKAAAQGLATGFGMGGGHAIISRPNQAAQEGSPAGPAPGGDVDAADLLGAPEQPAQQTEADKALYTPKSLTALDRVNEIDTKLAAATPEESSALQAERDQITASWPKYVTGDATTVTLPSGAKVAAHWAVVDASEPAASHDVYGNENPAYDKELQPRERGDRHAYRVQVSKITQNLDPDLLYESPLAGTGAPTLRADGPVVDGNGRESAIQAAYQANGIKADLLRNHVRSNAPSKGIPPEAIAHIQNPQFVRVIDHGQGIDYVEFSRQANGSIAARMSPSEQAKSDAAQIDSLEDLNPDEAGDFMSGSSTPFVRRFLAKLAGTESAGLVDATGRLSQAGYTRIRNAVLAKAYGDSPVLLRMVESLDDNSRNVSKALLRVAPQVAKARESMAAGALHPVDLIPDLMAAVEELSDLKEKGTSVDQALAQAGMFGDKLSPEARQLLVLLNENARSPRRIAEFIQAYLDALEAAGNPSQGSMFGDNQAPTKSDLMTAARRATNADTTTSGGTNAGDANAAEKGGGKPADAPRDQAGNGSNEAAGRGAAEVGGEWRLFGPETGTMGIPRADMPQVKGEHRGALIQFLDGLGISHKTVQIPASKLKPTQAEFSTKKAEGWKEVREGSDRSVLASSDGYILDGHHQWVAALALGETEQVIQFDAPIRELLAATFRFPSVKQSEGANVVELRAKGRQDFKDALADLAQIASKHTRAAMVPENTPNLMPTLIKLSEAAIKEVGYQIKDIIAHVKQALRSNEEFKKLWNKIDNAIYKKAAEKAAEQASLARVDDLFSMAEERKGQLDIFSQPTKGGSNVGQKTAEVLTKGGAGKSIEQGAPGSPKYRAYMLTEEDRAKLLRQFPPTHERVIADHISAQSLDSMHLVKEGPAKAEVIGVADAEGVQSLIVSINGSHLTANGTPFHISWSSNPGVKTGGTGAVVKKHGFTKLDKPIPIDLSAGPTYSAPLRPAAASAPTIDLMFGPDKPPKDKPMVLVFGGSFNPIHESHVDIVKQAKQMLVSAGYDVTNTIVVPSPQHLLVRKSGDKAQGLGHRTAMAKEAFAKLEGEGFTVEDEPSRIADANEGIKKPKRYDVSDWAQEKYPGATVVNVTGQDQAHEEAPGFPSVYKVQSASGKNSDGYYFLALPRDESEDTGVSSSKIRKMVESDKAVPAEWVNSGVLRYFRALTKKSREIAIDGLLKDLDALDFGEPFPRTLADNDPLLKETYSKARHDEVAKSKVVFEGHEIERGKLWEKIIEEHFKKAVPPTGRKPIAYVMGGGGASGKGTVKKILRAEGVIQAANAVDIDADDIKKALPEFDAAWQAGDSRGAAVVHEESSMLSKAVRKRAFGGEDGKGPKYDVILDVTLGSPKKGVEALQELKDLGYEVRLFGVNVEPENAVRRAIERGFGNGRFVPLVDLLKAHKGFAEGWEQYWRLADEARLYDTTDGQMNVAEKQQGILVVKHHKAYNRFEERRFINEQARTYRELGSYRKGTVPALQESRKEQGGIPPDGQAGIRGGGLEGQDPESGDQGKPGPGIGEGGLNGQDRKDGTGGDEGKGAGPASTTGESGQAPVVPGGPGGPDQRPDLDAGGSPVKPTGNESGEKPGGKGGDNQHGNASGDGNRTGGNAGLPAGRDIPAKIGRNYAFGDGDLTYAGSWQVKARQNVEAVELLKKLEAEGRQATQEEQAILAKFIGWGASEIANSIFGDKLDDKLEAISNYETALRYMESAPYGLRQRESGFYQAFQVLAASDPKKYQNNYYSVDRITKEMLEKARPDMAAKKWGELRDRLKTAMTEAEWDAASRSTQYAHYTSKPVVKSLLAAVSKMGFKGGTILEPGAGIGVFPGLMAPEVAGNSIYTGIEYDPITGGILKQLFPDERILVESFMDTKLPNNFYDVAFGNPPFSGKVRVLSDPKYVKHAFKLHDYFFAKSLDSVKPGGLLVFVTSRYTMDKKGDKARAFMAERADLVGAIRLPQTAFQKNAGTEVVTDILFLRKKVPGQTFDQAQPWMGLGEVQTDKTPALVNEYFAAHPEMVMGKHALAGSMYSKNEYTVLPNGGDIEAQIVKAVENLPADVFVAGRGSAAEAAKVREMDFDPKAKKEGSFYLSDAGVLMQREGGVGVRADEKHQKNQAILKSYITLRDAVKQAQLDQLSDGDWESSLKSLQSAYAEFVKKHGRLYQNTPYMQNVKVDELDEDGVPTGKKIPDREQRRRFTLHPILRSDPDSTLVLALEDFNEETGEIKDGEWLTKRTLGKPAVADIRTPSDALLATLDDTGEVDIPQIAARLGMDEEETVAALGSLIYDDPAQGWVMADEYLSGNVKKKLAEAEEALKSDKRYARNVEALKTAQPAPRSPDQITPQLGMNWIPASVYQDFLRELAGVRAKIQYIEATREWSVVAESGETGPRATVDWGVSRRENAAWLLLKAMTGAPIRLTMQVPDGKGGTKPVFDPERTESANEKRKQMRAEFRQWLFKDADRTSAVVKLYNDKFNTTVQRKFDGKHLTLPGTSKLFDIFDHVKRGAWRIIQTGNTYLAHAVGSGKTFEMVIAAMEQKRLGKIKKPMVIVPGHMLQQFASEWQQLYPTARLMVADEVDFHTENRRKFVARVAMSDLDGVIMTHSAFKILDLDPAFKQKMIDQELEVMRASYVEAGGDLDSIGDKKKGGPKDPKIKRIEAQIEALEQQLAKVMSSEGKDKNVRFDELGVDFLMVDEGHLYRKLSFASAKQIKGLDPVGSQMSWDLYMKTRWLAEKNPTRFMVMASGTPITNTTAELYTVQRYLAPQVLEDNGLAGFDDWAAQFGEESTTVEPTATGAYEPVTRFQEFVNVGEMTQMFRDFADVLNEDQLAKLLGDKRPSVVGGTRKSVITPKTAGYTELLENVIRPRIAASKAWKWSREEPVNRDPIITINGDANLASIDPRFLDPSMPNDPESKLNQLIDGVIRVYKETADFEYREKSKEKDAAGNAIPGPVEPIKGATQMVFFEKGFGEQAALNRGFNARAWMEKRLRDSGIPASQIAFMADYKKSSAKLKLFADVNKGKVRVLIGSSAGMGTGVNAQQRLIAMHHLDAPQVPAVLEQREGRIIRQGNKNKEVQIYAYSMFGSFDENQWSMLARKRFFIEQALSGDPNIRSIEDVGEVNHLQLAAGLVAENPFVIQHAGAQAEVDKLTRLYRAHEDARGRMFDDYQNAARSIEYNEANLAAAEKEAGRVKDLSGANFTAKAGGQDFDKRKEWASALLARFKELSDNLEKKVVKVGELSGFDIEYHPAKNAEGVPTGGRLFLATTPATWLTDNAATDPVGMAVRATNALVEIARAPVAMRTIISDAKARRDSLRPRLDAEFPLAQQLANKVREAADLQNKMLNYGKAPPASLKFDAEEWGNSTTPYFSRGTRAVDTGVSVAAVEQAAKRLFEGLKNPPKLKVVWSPKDLPFQAESDVKGAFNPADRTVYLVAGNLGPEVAPGNGNVRPMADIVREVVAHETMGHYGLRGFFGKALDSALLRIHSINPQVRTKAAAWVARNEKFIAELKDPKGEFKLTDADVHAISIEEALSEIVQTGKTLNGARALAAGLQKLMRGIGLQGLANKLESKTDAEALLVLKKAELFVKRGWNKDTTLAQAIYPMWSRMLSDDLAEQEKWLDREAKARGYKSIDELAEKAYPVFEKLAKLWRDKHPVEVALFSRATPAPAAKTADDIINEKAGTRRPIDAVAKWGTQLIKLDKATTFAYDKSGAFLDRHTPETIKAGVISDYGIPEDVTDQRAITQGRQKQQIRAAGALLEKLATLTRAESRIAYQWMNSADPQSSDYFMGQLPPESIKVLAEVEKMIDSLSKEAVALGQLDPDAYKRNRFAYLHRSYAKHEAELTKGESAMRKRAIAILGDQYKGRGMSDKAAMKLIQNIAPEWWGRKTQNGKADKGLKGEQFIRLERRASVPSQVTAPLMAAQGPVQPGANGTTPKGKLLEVAYWPANEPIPARYGAWDRVGTWEVRDTKGADLILWRDFTAAERQAMGEIDEVRYAIAKTLHGMIHDVEIGKYLQYLAQKHAKKKGETITGTVVEASDRMRDVFKPGEWVQVPETVIPGTQVKKYGTLAGRYLPGPVWNDVRQVVGFRYQPMGDVYAKIHTAWKTSKTALSPAVHMNNIMANFVMADWHDVSAGHIVKALKLMTSKGAAEAEVLARFGDSGGSIGTWAAKELQQEQLRPILDALQKELGLSGNASAQVGAMAALQLAVRGRFPSAWEALKPTKGAVAATKAARAMLDMYEAEDQVFRLAAWLKAKEEGKTDMEAGKLARKSFLDYSINAPWVQMMRNSVLPFVSFTYRAVPMLLDTAAHKPWKILKLGMLAGAINAMGYMFSGGDEDDERRLLPEEKSGRVWGIVPKLIRMPWHDDNGSPVFLDIRRWVPVGDVLDVGQSHSAVPLLPGMTPGGPLMVMGELLFDLSQFTGKKITLDTDTPYERAEKIAGHLYKAFAPNIAFLPGTYAWTGIANAGKGKTDTFGREQSVTQAVVSSIGIKAASYPKDVLQLNETRKMQAQMMEIDHNITQLKREYRRNGITSDELREKVTDQIDKKRKIIGDMQKKMGAK